MTRYWNVVAQVILAGGQIINVLEPIMKPEHKVYAVSVIGVLQILVSILAHEFNPDGTPAKVAYTGNTLV